ncbi:MAG: monovalent cation/H+ antiporter complex subunit F [Bacteroidota bacterium]
MDFLSITLKVSLAVLIVAFFLTMIRLAKGPRLYDRVVALDLVTSISAGIILVYAIMTGKPMFVDVAVIIFLIAFLGTVAISKYLTKVD